MKYTFIFLFIYIHIFSKIISCQRSFHSGFFFLLHGSFLKECYLQYHFFFFCFSPRLCAIYVCFVFCQGQLFFFLCNFLFFFLCNFLFFFNTFVTVQFLSSSADEVHTASQRELTSRNINSEFTYKRK